MLSDHGIVDGVLQEVMSYVGRLTATVPVQVLGIPNFTTELSLVSANVHKHVKMILIVILLVSIQMVFMVPASKTPLLVMSYVTVTL